MLLLDEDVIRIASLGHDEHFFARVQDGFKVLRNSEAGRCVFHDGKKCTIYENRPKGCKLYPIIFDVDSKSAVKDTSCPYRKEFKILSEAKQELPIIYFELVDERSRRSKISRKVKSPAT